MYKTPGPEKPRQTDETTNVIRGLVVHLLRDAAVACAISGSVLARDIDYVTCRFDAEGLSFATEALPRFGKSLDVALAKGRLPVAPPFSKVKEYRDCQLPCFMHEYWQIVVDAYLDADGPMTWTGHHVAAVRAIRQISYLAYKLRVPSSEQKTSAALKNVVDTDASLPPVCAPFDETVMSRRTREAVRTARILIGAVLGDDPRYSEVLMPRHGTGALATREKQWEKFRFRRFYPQLDAEFPYSDHFYCNYSHLAECLGTLEMLEPMDPISRGSCVPKDSRGPRVISMEPLEIMFIQQALMRWLVGRIETHQLTRGLVNFTSQEVNRRACLKASYDLEYDTLDLKDASDRVSAWLIRGLYPENWTKMLLAARSVACDYPDGTRLALRKLAPMGSAVCFPIEALTFWALAVGAQKTIITAGDLKRLPGTLVFGDDIIAPRGAYEHVKEVFHELHLRLNEDKCCTGDTPFRESCGIDALCGVNVAPVRIKHLWRLSSPEAHLAWVAYANKLTLSGIWSQAGTYLRDTILDDQFSSAIVTGDPECEHPLGLFVPGLHWTDVLSQNAHLELKWRKSLQRWEYRARNVAPVTQDVTRRGWDLLYEHLTSCPRTLRNTVPLGKEGRNSMNRSTTLFHLTPVWCESGCDFTITYSAPKPPVYGKSGKQSRRYAVPHALRWGYGWTPIWELMPPDRPSRRRDLDKSGILPDRDDASLNEASFEMFV